MIKKILIPIFLSIFFLNWEVLAKPIVSGISTNEINIDTDFHGAKILLFGAKGDAGNIIIAVRGPKKSFLVTKKEKLMGIWYNGARVRFNDSNSFYSLFSTFHNQPANDQEDFESLLASLELGKNNLTFLTENESNQGQNKEFKLQLIERLEKNKLYLDGINKVEFLDETLFKIMLDFPKNITRGVYTVEIYLINEGGLASFQAIPIYVNQVGFSAKVLDYAYQESFLYAIATILIAIVVGYLANYLFVRFVGK